MCVRRVILEPTLCTQSYVIHVKTHDVKRTLGMGNDTVTVSVCMGEEKKQCVREGGGEGGGSLTMALVSAMKKSSVRAR